ncbi:multidrug DMT transporter permease [Paramagnetospirillum kuznetsovii]|uniref:Multidrug DMT transporter permease n=1 Tax=Paramagnetospirillum kuznetsovii TaxID=2053833 RepID=A0A364NYA8_9PROT|nr:EamA family transporter [Paramagnetospirillum kuznetsovii]RAU22033.1 multidrug DMT transporter permease [Paramagnetospirillum kuznetsovii]
MNRFTPADWTAALAVSLLWGGNVVAVKAATLSLPPFLLTGMRFALVALVLAPLFRPRLDQLRGILGLSVVLGIGHFGLLFAAINGMDAASAGIAIQLATPFSAVIAWLAYREALGWARGVGMTVAFAGVVVLAGEPHLDSPVPLVIMSASALSWAISNVMIKRIGPVDPLAINGWVALFSFPMLLAISFAFETDHWNRIQTTTAAGWAGLAYTTIGSTLIAYTLWYKLVARHSLNRIVPFTLLGPAVGLLGGVLLLDEPLTWHKLLGGALTVAGVAVIQLWPGRTTT